MKVTIAGTEYLPIAEVAKELATTEIKILMLIKRKALEGELVEGAWYVTVTSLKEFDPTAYEPQLPSCRSSCKSATCGCS